MNFQGIGIRVHEEISVLLIPWTSRHHCYYCRHKQYHCLHNDSGYDNYNEDNNEDEREQKDEK